MRGALYNRLPSSIGVLVASVLASAEARADRPYSEMGKLSVKVETLSSNTKIVAPQSGGPYPLIVASHGWSASGDNQLGWAKQFASWGFVVAVPSFPSPMMPDAQVNSDIIVGLANDLRGASPNAHNVLAGKVGLEGHSAGGLATTLAASKLGASVGAVVLFDPVDRNDVGKAAYSGLCAPILGVFAKPSSCNTNAGWRAFATSTKAELVGFDVVGSTHCDGENSDRGMLCGMACGGAANPARQKVYASYATAFLLARLSNDASAAALIANTNLVNDAGVTSVIHTTSSCAAPVDGAPRQADTWSSTGLPINGPESSGAGSANASPEATGASDPVSAPSPDEQGGSCRAAGPASGTTITGVLAVLALLLFGARRRS